ncbi:MAG: M56 family metallopeptidase [Verrucomicrobiota bacterium]
MNPPDLEFWGRTFGVLAVEFAAVAGVAGAFARTTKFPATRKRIWQGALLTGILLVLGEVTGLRHTWRLLPVPFDTGTPAARRIVATVAAPSPAAEVPSAEVPWQESASQPAAQPKRIAVWWPLWIWIGGAGLVVARTTAIRLWLLRARKHARPGTPEFQTMLETLAPRLGLQCVHLCVWQGLRGPVAFGLFRPTIALPADLDRRFSPAQQEAMMAHELAHLAGRDPAWLAVADLLVALMWWHPAIGWMRRRFQSAAEAMADTASSLVPQGPASLAESLIQLGRDWVPPSPIRGLGVAGGGFRSELGRRVDGLIHGTPVWQPARRSDRIKMFGVVLLAAALGSLLPLPGRPDRSLLSVARAATPSPAIDPQSTRDSGRVATVRSAEAPNSGVPPAAAPPAATAARPGLQLEIPGSGEVKSTYVALREPTPADFLPPKPSEPSSVELLTRVFHLDADKLHAATQSILEVPPAETPSARVVWELFKTCGIDFGVTPIGNPAASERALYFNTTRGLLFVRASAADLDAVERVLQGTQASESPSTGSTPRITLNTWFAEIVAGGADDLGLDWIFGVSPTNNPATENLPLATGRGRIEALRNPGQVTTLTGTQFDALQKRLSERSGVDWLHGPAVTTRSGMEARVQVQDIRTIVTGVTARVDPKAEAVGFDGVVVAPTNAPASVEYGTEQMAFGPEILVRPEAENDRWNLQLTARMTEFLGYDDPGPVQATIRTPNAKPLKAVAPLPRLRIREASAWANVGNGDVVALRGPMAESQNVEKGGLFRRGATNVLHKRLYVFIQAETTAPGTAGIEAPGKPPYLQVVRIPKEGDLCHIGKREVREFELSGVIRSLALAHPELRLLIRNEPGVSKEWTRRIQDAAMEAGVENLLLYAMEK